MELWFWLVCAAALLLLAAVLVLAGRLRRVDRRLRAMQDILEDIRQGNGNRRLLVPERDPAAPLAYQMNAIVCGYEEQLAALRRAGEANRQLMTSLSHDVRTPLTTLIGYLDAAHRGLVAGAERDEAIAAARRKAYALKDYIDVLFDWFKLNSGEYALSAVPVELGELMRELLADWVPVWEEKGLDYVVDIPDRPLTVRADPDGCARILNNLVQNVLAHSQASRIEVTLRPAGQTVRLCVADNGVGIGRADLPHLFDRLYKCDKSRGSQGSGLGLSIVQQIAQQMGGAVSAQSEPGRRTEFAVQLPLLTQ